MKFTWNPTNYGRATIRGQDVFATARLDLGFEYDAIDVDSQIGRNVVALGDKSRPMTPAELQMVQAYLQGLEQLFERVPAIFGVDAEGYYLGEVPVGTAQAAATAPPARQGWRWDGDEWVEDEPLEALIASGLLIVDGAAGSARTRYITAVPGQEATYVLKAAQSVQWLEDPGQIPGAFLVAEAEATGLSLTEAAQAVVSTSNMWTNVIGPAIERERRRAKLRISRATSHREVREALEQGVAFLQQI